jgi:iron complex transport system substrate-binding protein
MIRKTILILTFLSLLIVGCDAANTAAADEPTLAPTTPPTVEPIPTDEPEPGPLVLIDGQDRTVELAQPAKAIVTLGPSTLESLFAIGAGDHIVGREEYSTYPDEALDITSVGSLWEGLPFEAIVALEPDLVIAPQIISPEQVTSLEDLGLTVFWQANPDDFEGLYTNLTEMATLTGHEDDAVTLIEAISQRVAAVEAIIATIDNRPTIFYELDATDPLNPFTTGGGTFIDTLITMAGGTNIGAVLDGDYAMISSEEVILQNPEVILLADAPYGITPESVAERPGWNVISAVQNGKVFPFDPFLVSVPGPRMVDGLEAMAKLLHPDLFK